MSTLPPQEVINAIEGGNTQVTRRLEFYEYDGVTRWYPDPDEMPRITDGSVNLDYTRSERRTLDLSLDNDDNALRPDPDFGLWYDKVIKVYRGVNYWRYNTGVRELAGWEAQLGEFLIDKIDEDNYPHITKLTCRDYTKRCLTSKTEQSMLFATGTNVIALVRAVAANAGIVKFRLPVGTEVLNTELAIERGTERWSLIYDVANSYGYEIYFDAHGYLTMRKFLDPSTSPTAWTFQTGAKGNLVKWSRSTNDSRLYNHVIVYSDGGGDDALPFFGEAKNQEPSSPTRIQRIGDRLYEYSSSYFTSDQQCADLANSWLKVKALESYESSWDSFNYPWMEVGEIVGFLDPRRSDIEPTRYLMDTLTIPLGLGPMSATAKRVTYVNDPGTQRVDTTDDTDA